MTEAHLGFMPDGVTPMNADGSPMIQSAEMDGDGQLASGWGDGADTGGGLDGLAPIGDMAAPMDPLGDAMAGTGDPMAGSDPMGGAPAFDGAMAAMDGAAAANMAEGMEAANVALRLTLPVSDAPTDDALTVCIFLQINFISDWTF